MNRTLSFSYNAIATLGEIVADRLVKASFLDGTISETITTNFSLGGNLTGTMHAFLSNPAVEFGVGARDRVSLSLDVHAVLEFPSPPNLLGLADGDWLKARVSVKTQLITKGTTLRPNLTTLKPIDVYVDNANSNNSSLKSWAPFILKSEIPKALGSPMFNKLDVDLGFDPKSFLSNALDVAVIDGPPPEDRDELALAFYHTADQQQTRGNTDDIQPFLGVGKSLTIRVSKPIFDALINEELAKQFMRFDVKLGDPLTALSGDPGPDQKQRGIRWRQQDALEKLSWTTPSGDYLLFLDPDPSRANLYGGTVTNLRTGEQEYFATNSLGAAKIGFGDLQKGDVLRFHGEYKYEKKAKVYYPSFVLGDGYIKISATAVADEVACYDNVTAYLKGNIYFFIDPATGDFSVKAGEVDVDLPWYVDGLKVLLYLFTGPYAGIIIGGYESEIVGEVTEKAKGKTSALLPAISGKGNLKVFWEDIALKADGVILHGQIEAGWLRSGGRSAGLKATVDQEGDYFQQIEIYQQSGYASLQSSIPAGFDTSAVTVVNKTVAFEQIGPEDIAQITAGVTDRSVSVPGGDALEGLVLAVRTARHRYAKVRVDRGKKKNWVLRWITYNVPQAPKVEIVAIDNWGHDEKFKKYWRTFSLKTHRIYRDYGFKINWQCSGLLKKTEIPGQPEAIRIDIGLDTDWSLLSFFGLKVKVKDIFGREASEEITLWPPIPEVHPRLRPFLLPDPNELIEWLHGPHPVARHLLRVAQVVQILEQAGFASSTLLKTGVMNQLLIAEEEEIKKGQTGLRK